MLIVTCVKVDLSAVRSEVLNDLKMCYREFITLFCLFLQELIFIYMFLNYEESDLEFQKLLKN